MSELIGLTAAELAQRLASGEVTSLQATQAHLDRIGAAEEEIHAFLHVNTDEALAAARNVDARRAAGEDLPERSEERRVGKERRGRGGREQWRRRSRDADVEQKDQIDAPY